MTLNLKEQIIQLWNEFRNLEYIAQKIGMTDENGDPDVNKVSSILGIGYANDAKDKQQFALAEESAYKMTT